MRTCDYLIAGAGIVGLAIARELKIRYPQVKVVVLEKELKPGLHSSGRNSGVLHSGIYYPSDSLKSRVCTQGAREMADFCIEHKLPLNRIGKILLPISQDDAFQLKLLEERALANNIDVQKLDSSELKKLEPEAHSATGEALFVRSTSVADPTAVMSSLVDEVERTGVEIECEIELLEVNCKNHNVILSNGAKFSYGHFVNTAGLHADRIAHKFSVGMQYTLLPFKGIYWKLDPKSGLDIRHLIYPVPDLRVPFLGIHTTTAIDGSTYLGPTAVPAFGRENYQGLQNVTIPELMRIMWLLIKQTVNGQDGFRRLAWQEGRRYFKPWFVEAARSILPNLRNEHLIPCNKVGIRAQMYNLKTNKLVRDFLVERGTSSTHVLNAISPAWTSAFPFARFVLDEYVEKNE